MNTETTTARIRALNDAERWCLKGGLVDFTNGIASLLPKEQAVILDRVRTFDDFTPANDPHDEHDFGAFAYKGRTVYWKIEYYDLLRINGSSDPSDPALTRRVLTVTFADEY